MSKSNNALEQLMCIFVISVSVISMQVLVVCKPVLVCKCVISIQVLVICKPMLVCKCMCACVCVCVCESTGYM